MKPFSIVVVLFFAIAAFIVAEWRPWRAIEPASDMVGITKAVGHVSNMRGSAAQFAEDSLNPERPLSSNQSKVLSASQLAAQLVTDKPSHPGLSEQLIKAQLMPANYTTLVAEMSGRIVNIEFKDGESFAKDAVLVEFDCELQRAQLQRVRAEMAIAARNADANTRLLVRGAVSQLEADNAKSEFERAQAQARELEVLVKKCAVLAPYAGKVGERFVRTEQFVQAGEPLMDILDDSAMELEFIVPSAWIAWLSQGQAFDVEMEETQRNYPATVNRVGARIDPISRTIKVVGVINGQFDELKPGMSGSIKVDVPPNARGSSRAQ